MYRHSPEKVFEKYEHLGDYLRYDLAFERWKNFMTVSRLYRTRC